MDSVKLEIGYDCTLPPGKFCHKTQPFPYGFTLCCLLVQYYFHYGYLSLIRQLCRALVQFYQKTSFLVIISYGA